MTRRNRRKQKLAPLDGKVRLGNWAAKGSVEAVLDGETVLVDRGIPGESAEVRIQRGKRPWRGSVQQVVEPAPARVTPPCPYYLAGCGGCQWQHVAYSAQVEQKRAFVNGLLTANGLTARVDRVHVPKDPWRYRHTAAVAIGWEAGFRPIGRRGIVEIHDCLISHPLIGSFASQLNHLLEDSKVPNYHGKVWLECSIVGSGGGQSVQVLLQGIGGLDPATNPELGDVAEILAALPGVSTVAYRHRSGETRPLIGPLSSTVDVGEYRYWLPSGSFFQTNPEMLLLVIEAMRRHVAKRRLRTGADVYGGVGTLGLPLAKEVDIMTIIELDPRAIEAARQTASDWGLDNVAVIAQHAEKALQELEAVDFVVVDPPRSGLEQTSIDALVDRAPPLLMYLSCGPRSLAEDLSLLCAGGYSITDLELYDFYPQTYHVETLAVLER